MCCISFLGLVFYRIYCFPYHCSPEHGIWHAEGTQQVSTDRVSSPKEILMMSLQVLWTEQKASSFWKDCSAALPTNGLLGRSGSPNLRSLHTQVTRELRSSHPGQQRGGTMHARSEKFRSSIRCRNKGPGYRTIIQMISP